MACLLTTGRKIPCKSGFGGIKTVYFADYGTIASITLDADNLATIVHLHRNGLNIMLKGLLVLKQLLPQVEIMVRHSTLKL